MIKFKGSRRELMAKCDLKTTHPGQTLRFEYETGFVTATVLYSTSTTVKATIDCGTERGICTEFLKIEMVNCTELFGSSVLHNLYENIGDCEWTKSPKSHSSNFPVNKPSLRP